MQWERSILLFLLLYRFSLTSTHSPTIHCHCPVRRGQACTKRQGREFTNFASTYVCVWVDVSLGKKLYVLFLIIIIFPETHHVLLFTACSLTLNPLSGCRTAASEKTVRESMYRVSPQALLLICTVL